MMSQPSKNKYLSCLSSVIEMKRKGVKPNLIIYNELLAAAAERGQWLDAFAIMDDMLSMKIKPNAITFNHLFHVCVLF
jgi:pentatricopeptide repeat protein